MSVSRYALLALTALLPLSGPTAAAATRPPAAAAEIVPASAAAVPLPQLTRIRTGLIPIIPSAVFFVPMDKGYFAQEGIEVDWQPVQVTTEAIAQVAAGNLELASATVGAAVLNGFSRGVDTKILSGLHGNPPSGPGGDPFIVRKDLYDSGQVRDAALRGRKVATNSAGVFAEYAVNGAMQTAGLSVADVDFTPIQFPDIPQALANNAVDAAFVPEPFGTAAIEAGYAVQIVPEFLRGAQITVLVGGPSLLRDRPLTEAFMRGLLRGLSDLATQGWVTPENAAIIEKYTRVPAGTVAKIIPQYCDPDGRINWDSLMDQQRFYMSRGEVTYAEPLDLLQWSDDSARQAALRALGR